MKRRHRVLISLALAGAGAACHVPDPPPPAEPPEAAPPARPPPPPPPQLCRGTLTCTLYPSAEAAFARVLEDHPRVLGVGETHAPADVLNVTSSAHRFTESLLPALEGRASDLVLELWVANGACGAKEKKVAAQQKDVTATQAKTDQNEFVQLGDAAKARGIQPHVLTPSCAEYARILDAGAGDVEAMLEMIARLSRERILALVAKNAKADAGVDDAGAPRMVLAYGGAMHNDRAPRAGREDWSYGPQIAKATGDKYVELDLIVPEFVKDTDAWRAQPWFADFDRERHGPETVLITVRPGSYALVFPKTGSGSRGRGE